MLSRTSRRTLWAVLVLVVLGLLVPPYVNVNRYRKRVADAIGRALGREVTVSQIALQLLPRPGLILSNFEVADDPTYGAEPMLQASTVTALLRLTSLWRGRLEIGTLELDSPSLNLVRRADGHWNLEELVERTAQVPSAPTSKTHPEARPRFPYVEAATGRINFKLGQVKKAFAITDADFGLWQESEREWGVRLEGRPVRTDVGISDTGLVNLEGRFQPASSLSSTPLNVKLSWNRGQLGQVTKLVFGRDRGWRGGLSSSATLTGTPSGLGITFDGQVDDFRRYDIALGEALRFRAHCTGTYSSPDDALHDLQCESPVGAGVLRVRGEAQGWIGDAFNLSLSGEQVPMERVIAFARHAKKDLPNDLTASGDLEGAFTVRKSSGATPVWSGGGTARNVALHSGVLKKDLDLGEAQFAIPAAEIVSTKHHLASRKHKPPIVAATLQLVVKPFPVALGADSPATASGVLDGEHYEIDLSGNAELSRLLSVARALGIGTPGIGLAGDAQVNLAVSGTWAGFAPPIPSGKVQITDATAELQGVSQPLQIASASASIANQVLTVSSFSASFIDGPDATGSARFPVHCTTPETCTLRFDVHTGEVALAQINQLVNPTTRPWYHLLTVWQQRDDALLKLRARGHFFATRLTLESLVANNISGTAEVDAGRLRLSDLRADLLGGHHTGVWTADFTLAPPRFEGEGTLSKLSMAQLAALMHDNWATGTVDAQYTLAMQGLDRATLRRTAGGAADFAWTNGSLRHVILEGKGAPMSFTSLAGTLSLRNASFRLADSKLQAGNVVYTVKGTATYDRNLDLRLEHAGGRSYAISGPLDKPHVETVPSPSTEAAALH